MKRFRLIVNLCTAVLCLAVALFPPRKPIAWNQSASDKWLRDTRPINELRTVPGRAFVWSSDTYRWEWERFGQAELWPVEIDFAALTAELVAILAVRAFALLLIGRDDQ